MILTNEQIFNFATKLTVAFKDVDIQLPIKVNFYLAKNKNMLLNLAQEIEQARMNIIQNHSIYLEESQEYQILEEQKDNVMAELKDLFNLKQEVQIYTVLLNDFNSNTILTPMQMEAIMFMIEE